MATSGCWISLCISFWSRWHPCRGVLGEEQPSNSWKIQWMAKQIDTGFQTVYHNIFHSLKSRISAIKEIPHNFSAGSAGSRTRVPWNLFFFFPESLSNLWHYQLKSKYQYKTLVHSDTGFTLITRKQQSTRGLIPRSVPFKSYIT